MQDMLGMGHPLAESSSREQREDCRMGREGLNVSFERSSPCLKPPKEGAHAQDFVSLIKSGWATALQRPAAGSKGRIAGWAV